MGDPELYRDPEAAQKVAEAHKQAQEDLEALYEEWSEMEEA